MKTLKIVILLILTLNFIGNSQNSVTKNAFQATKTAIDPKTSINSSPKVSPTVIKTADSFYISAPLRDMPIASPSELEDEESVFNKQRDREIIPNFSPTEPEGVDPTIQDKNGTIIPGKATTVNWAGQNSGSYPPDCNGSVNENYYFQVVNTTYRIYDKTGATYAGPANLNTIFNPSLAGATCNDGDPIVLWDEQAQKWFYAEFSLCQANDRMLIAVSQTSDPGGSWWSWSFDVADTPDYMKFGIWQDGYYMATNTSGGNDVYCFERNVMINGGANPTMIAFDNPNRPATFDGFHCIMPLDNDGQWAPAGTPGGFITVDDNSNQLWIYDLIPDWGTPANSTFQRVQTIPVSAFTGNFTNDWNNIYQPGTTQRLDAISTVLMFRAQYRNWSGTESIVCCHTIDVGSNKGGIRWYELESTGGNWSIKQQGTYAPDGDSRWNGSIAMNDAHQIGLGYSVSSSTTYPSIRYCGQTSCAPTGVMDIAETTIWTGTNSQTAANRWGDYTNMSVDPADGLTFWFSTEYMAATTHGTRIAAFTVDESCAAPSISTASPTVFFKDRGKQITLTGSGFLSSSVEIGGVSGTVVSNNGTTMVVDFPPGNYTNNTLTITNGSGSDTYPVTVNTRNIIPVDGSVGFNDDEHLTIQGAADGLFAWWGTSNFDATKTIEIYNGTYAEGVTLNAGLSPTAANKLIIHPASGQFPIINATGQTFGLNASTVSNVTIEGLTIYGATEANINTNGDDNEIALNKCYGSTYGSGIKIDNAINAFVHNNLVYNNSKHGIHAIAANAAIIKNNTAHNNGANITPSEQTIFGPESFETSVPPAGWSEYGTGWDSGVQTWIQGAFTAPPTTPDGSSAAIIQWDATNRANRSLETPAIDLNGYGNVDLKFWFFRRGAWPDTLHVEVSTDGGGAGGTWTSVLEHNQSTQDNNEYVYNTVNLNAFIGNVVHLRFRYGQLDGNSQGLDMVEVFGTMPASNEGNGLYVESGNNVEVLNNIFSAKPGNDIYLAMKSDVNIKNSSGYNTYYDSGNLYFVNHNGTNYSNLATWNGTAYGNNDIDTDPMFVSTGTDFHIKSVEGSYHNGTWPPYAQTGGTWTVDVSTSTAVDAGDPSDVFANEPAGNGSRINQGAYGNTAQASKSFTPTVAPTLVNVTPNNFFADKGKQLTITGNDLLGCTAVIGGVAGSIVSNNGSVMVVDFPAGNYLDNTLVVSNGINPDPTLTVTVNTRNIIPVGGGIDFHTTIQNALNGLYAWMEINPFDATKTIDIYAGTYTETATPSINLSPTAANMLVIQAHSGDSPDIDATGLTNGISIGTLDYVRVTGLAIHNATGDNIITSGNNNEILLNKVYASTGASGIKLETGNNSLVQNNLVYDNFNYGIHLNTAVNAIVKNNTAYNNGNAYIPPAPLQNVQLYFQDWEGAVSNWYLSVGDWTIGTTSPYSGTYDAEFVAPSNGVTAIDTLWYSWENITGYTNIEISCWIKDNGTLEATDFIKGEYSIDGGAWVEFFYNENDVNSYIQRSVGPLAVTATALELRFIAQTNATNEFWLLEDIQIIGDEILQPNVYTGAGLYAEAATGSIIENNIFNAKAGTDYLSLITEPGITVASDYNTYFKDGNTNLVNYNGAIYTNLASWTGNGAGTSDLEGNPLFVTPGTDFHIQSTWDSYQGGTWPPTFEIGGTWTTDASDSPALDSGNPADDYSNEPASGNRINQGAYGNTAQASKTGCSAIVSVSIVANPSTPICEGSGSIDFTATPVNGGTTPSYQWQVNGTNVGTDSPTYTLTSPVNGDAVTCILTSDDPCATGNPATSNTFNVIINPLPTVLLNPFSDVCAGSATFALSGGSPAGGTYTGTGVTGGNFSPVIAGVGTHTITYTYTDGNGCSDFTTQTITVNSLPTVTLGTFSDVCEDASAFALTGGSPVGGTYSGPGVTGGNFNPATAGAGTHTITYTYTDGNGCSNFATQTITVNSTPTVTLAPFSAVCVDASTFTLSGGIPAGGTYTGTGVSAGSFNPATAGVGTHTITYTYTDGNGCSGFATQNIVVNALPTVTLNPFSAVCASAASFSLTGGSPAGGTYSGTGVSGGNFSPSTAGVGTHTITYTYTDGNGCSDFTTQTITVNEVPTVNAGIDQSIPYGTPTSLNATVSGGSGTYNYSWSPAGSLISATVEDPTTINLLASTVFTLVVTDASTGCTASDAVTVTVTGGVLSVSTTATPLTICEGATSQLEAIAGGGTGTYTYSWSSNPVGFTSTIYNPVVSPLVTTTYTVTVDDGATTQTSSVTVTVNPLPTVTLSAFAGVCIDAGVQTLTGGSPAGGTYTGTGVSAGSFNPVTAGIGTHTITYTYTDVNGCSDFATGNITVNSLPTVTLASFSPVCVNDASFALTGGNPSGGVYSGTGVSAGSFNPATAGVGTHTITYTYTDVNGCDAAATQSITVNNLPTVTFAAIAPVCEDAAAFTLTGGSPAGGTYSGTGVSGTTFDPAVSGAGTFTITYSFTNVNGCTNTATSNITVNTLPTVSLVLSDVCIDAGVITLSGGSPVGGTYSGTGVSAGSFNPVTAGIGTHTITYTYTDVNGCTNSTTADITVNSLPTVTFSALADLCASAGAYTLTEGSPAGGTYSGTGVSGNIFDPSVSGTGTFTLMYTYTDGNSCTASASQSINVNAEPSASTTTIDATCGNADGSATVNATGGTGVYTYIWDDPMNQTSQNATGLAAGTYNVTVNDGNCQAFASATISEAGAPTVTISSATTTVCEGEVLMLIASGADSYVWTPASYLNTFTNDTVYATAVMDITYTVEGTTAGCSDTEIISITVDPLPAADYTYVANDLVVDFTNASANATSYLWDFGDGNTATSPDPQHIYGAGGTYSVTLIATNTCGSDTSTYLVDVITNVFGITLPNDNLTIYPNPNSGQFDVNFTSSNNDDLVLTVINPTGQIVYNNIFSKNDFEFVTKLDISNLAKGVYQLQIKQGEETFNSRVVIVKNLMRTPKKIEDTSEKVDK